MPRRVALVILTAWIACALSAGAGWADFEADLLKKFQTDNNAAGQKLKQEVLRLLNPTQSAEQKTEKELEPLRKLIVQLQEDIFLPRQERDSLIRKLQDRLRECKTQEAFLPPLAISPAKLPKQSHAKPSASDLVEREKPATVRDPRPEVKQDVFLMVGGPGVVVVPDRGTRSLGGYSYLAETRNEYGVPGLGSIPYLGRGFRNVGYSRISGGVDIVVTGRIIIMQEEEAKFLGR